MVEIVFSIVMHKMHIELRFERKRELFYCPWKKCAFTNLQIFTACYVSMIQWILRLALNFYTPTTLRYSTLTNLNRVQSV